MSNTVPVVVGSTAVITYGPTYEGAPVTPLTVTAALTDADQQPVTVAAEPIIGEDKVTLVLAADELPVLSAGETWKLVLTWTWENADGIAVERRYVMYLDLVDESPSVDMLCTLAQVKARIGFENSQYDDRIVGLIGALTPVVNARYGREFMGQTTATRTFPVRHHSVDLGKCDLRTASAIVLHPEATVPVALTANVDYVLDPVGGDELTGTYGAVRIANTISLQSVLATKFGLAQMEVTGEWGIWATTADVPADINQAAVECILSLIDRPSANISGMSSGAMRETAPVIPATWDIPFGAHRKFLPYSRSWGVY
jgi:hypothetical protein